MTVNKPLCDVYMKIVYENSRCDQIKISLNREASTSSVHADSDDNVWLARLQKKMV